MTACLINHFRQPAVVDPEVLDYLGPAADQIAQLVRGFMK